METINNIKRKIAEEGLSQSQLARMSGLAFGTINRILSGKQELKPNTLAKIAEALSVSVAELQEEDNANWNFNYAVQGYLQFADEITRITSFKQLKDWVKKYEPLVNEKPKKKKAILATEKKNAKKVLTSNLHIEADKIDFYRKETIDATKDETWSFRKAEDERDGNKIDLGNMCISYHFDCMGHTFTNSEALYICGLFSNDTEKHSLIQKKLIEAKSGYDAKKAVRKKYEDDAREDWNTFNVEYMKWAVWQKIKGSEDFRNTLTSIPREAYIIENSTHQTGETALFWGMSNKELEDARSTVEECVGYENPTATSKEIERLQMEERNKVNHIGVWEGVNCMGKILKYLQLCLLDGKEPQIDYDLLRSKQIYLFGKLLTFDVAISSNKTIIFDFDNTLLNTRPWKKYEYLFKEAKRGSNEWKQGRKEYLRHVTDCKQWEGMDEVIDYLRHHHIKTCVVTANTKDRVEAAIKAFGWGDVIEKDNIIGCYALGMKRASKDNGDPRLFIKAMEVLGVEPSECVAFGNEVNDTKAAQNVGIMAYNAYWGAEGEDKEIMDIEMKDLNVSNPLDIIDLLKK